jgi:hypothetical protein|tara:strand:+ start:18 stop:398 length:381 start_codon:yes stop_codon:yes gene_type:complete
MVNKVIENGVNTCTPEVCHSDFNLEIFVIDYPPVDKAGATIDVEWRLLNAGTILTEHILKWSADPFDLSNEIAPTLNVSGTYVVSFTLTSDPINYFVIQARVDGLLFQSNLFSIVITGTATTSSSS